MQKLLSVAIPCFNSQEYVRHAVDSLLVGGDDIEIIIVNDGSTDDTEIIAEGYAQRFPTIVKVVNKENGGHGDAVMAGIKEATGLYFRVVDSDDWVGGEALHQLLKLIKEMQESDECADLIITNFVHENIKEDRTHSMNHHGVMPVGRIFEWDEVKKFPVGSFIQMHSTTFRRQILIDSHMVLPKHTFYVDHLFVSYPLVLVEKLYYLDVDLYHYLIGRDGQSISEANMLARIDQQLRVNRLMLYDLGLDKIQNKSKRAYLYYYVEMMTMITVSILLHSKTAENEEVMRAFLEEIREKNPRMFKWIMQRPFTRHPMRPLFTMPRKLIYSIYRISYLLVCKYFVFN